MPAHATAPVAHRPEELVHTTSEDGWRLDGVVMRPEPGRVKPVAVVCVPGLYAAFYEPPYVALARALAARGYTCVVGNSRGHDFGAVLRGADGVPAPGGGGWERLAESPRDIGGWLDFVAGLGFAAVALLGHSLGARKVAYYQAERADPRVVGMIAVSPAAMLLEPPDATLLALARELVAAGRGRDLLPWPAAGCSMSAQTYLDHEDREGPFLNVYVRHGATYDAPLVARVACPLLAFFGALESRGCEGGYCAPELETIRRHATAAPRVDTLLIPGANHSYEGHEPAVAAAIAGWLDELGVRGQGSEGRRQGHASALALDLVSQTDLCPLTPDA